MNELKPKKKAESPKADKELQSNISKALKRITSKLVNDNELLTKKIEKWSKRLAKKVSKEIKAHTPVSNENVPPVKTIEITGAEVKEQPVTKKATARKKKIVAEGVK